MYEDNYFNPTNPNDYDDEKKYCDDDDDKCYDHDKYDSYSVNYLTRSVKLNNGRTKNKRIKVYTSGGPGSYIRDAETGTFYPNKVGSRDEELFYKVMVSTGECKSKNGSNTLFYCSPMHYRVHLLNNNFDNLQDDTFKWESRRDKRLKESKKTTAPSYRYTYA